MPEGLPGAPPPAAPAETIRPRTTAAWIVILLAVAGVVALHLGIKGEGGEGDAALRVALLQQVRLQYGIQSFTESFAPDAAGRNRETLLEALGGAFGKGPPRHRLRFAVVAADLRGPGEGLRRLDELDRLMAEAKREPAAEDAAIAAALRRLWAPGASPVPPEEDGALLRRGLDWFGELALAPRGSPGRDAVLAPARRVAGWAAFAGLGALAALALGCVGLVLLVVLASRAPRSPFLLAPGTAPSGIFAETFAVWLLLFVGLSAAAGLAAPFLGVPALGAAGAGMFLSLGALAWPVLRGVPFAVVRADLGLHLPATPVRDVLAGIGSWFVGLPAIATAFVATALLALAAGDGGDAADPLEAPSVPSHPVVGEMGDDGSFLAIALLACVLAPLVEETFFRGALYRHLREATGLRGRLPSAVISALVSGLLFAAVHPQGPAAIPLLMAVSFPLCLAREWRGSLLAPMAAHAFHNGLVTAFAWTVTAP